jgi:hypothetical protein
MASGDQTNTRAFWDRRKAITRNPRQEHDATLEDLSDKEVVVTLNSWNFQSDKGTTINMLETHANPYLAWYWEVTAKFKQFLSDMERLGLRVQNVQSDRGSEYFENEGESPVYGARRKHEFGLVCESHKIRHIVRPTEMHEFVAEGFWKDSF